MLVHAYGLAITKGNSVNNLMSYAYRYKAEVGDVVWAVTSDEQDKIHIDKVTIEQIQDNSWHTCQDADGDVIEVVQAEDFENYSIGYWIAEEDMCIGVAMYFGETLFLTEEEAQIEACNIEEFLKEEKSI